MHGVLRSMHPNTANTDGGIAKTEEAEKQRNKVRVPSAATVIPNKTSIQSAVEQVRIVRSSHAAYIRISTSPSRTYRL